MTTLTFTATGSPQLNTDVAAANADSTDSYIIDLPGGTVTGSMTISSNTTVVETAQVAFSAATIVNQGTYDIYYTGSNTDIKSSVLGISSDTASTFTNEGTFEQTV